jgi:hypothetical protein
MGRETETRVVRHAGRARVEVNTGPRVIRVTLLETEEVFLEALEQNPRNRHPWLKLGAVLLMLGFFFGTLVVAEYRHGEKIQDLPWIPITLSGGVALYVFAPPAQRWRFRRQLRKHLTDPPTEAWFEFGESGYLSTGKGGRSAFYPWPTVHSVVESPYGLAIGTSKEVFQWIPKRAFENAQDYDTLLGWVTQKVSRFERVRR